MSLDPDVLSALAELARRGPQFRLEDYCFPEQLASIRDPAKFKTELCSRRAGKTVGGAADLTDTCLTYPGTVSLYITLSRLNAKRIIWGELCEINRAYDLGGQPNESELCITYPNRSRVYLSGAKDKSEIEKFRGLALKKVRIDEAQAFRSYLRELIDEVLAKALFDHDGVLTLSGTPGPVPAGYFHEATTNPQWSHHHWTMIQNPHLRLKSGKDPMELILADCRRMGVSLDDPRIQRECFGRWVVDTNSLVFKWSEANDFRALPKSHKWSFVVGVDLGFDDSDAIAVLGWCSDGPEVYLVEEIVKAKQGISELAVQIGRIVERYQPLALVMDTGGLGAKIAEELRRRHALPVKAAKKTEKAAHIELVNDALRTRTLLAKRDSQFAQDSMMLEWDMDKSSGDKLVVADAFHSDICDAVLYAYREALGWLHVPEAPKPKRGTPEALEAEARQMEEALVRQINRDESDPAEWAEPDWSWTA